MNDHSTKRSIRFSFIHMEIIVCLFFGLFILCTNDNPNTPIDEYNKWTFSGYVVDGYSGKPLSNVSIFYRIESGIETEYITTSTGNFYINNLPFGEKNFRFVYNDSINYRYTEKLLVVSNVSSMAPPDGELADASRIVRLFPLNASISGKVIIKLRDGAMAIPAESTLVKVSFND